MTAMQPTRKDMAEFLRLSLVAGLCKPSTAAAWADTIVAAEQSPHIAFIELCIAGSQPASAVEALLADVPGQTTPELPVRMLLGHSARLIAATEFPPEQVLLRLYHLSRIESFPESIYLELNCLEDDYSLVRDGVYGTFAEIAQHIITFLNEYEPYAPDIPTGNATHSLQG
jgi:hypothetical protein